jgi:hypothetical protein
MKIKRISRAALLCVSLLGLSVPCLANETPASGNYTHKIQQEEAVVVRINQNNVTLQAIGDKDKITTAPFSNAAEFKVGDKVIIVGNLLKPSTDAASDTKTAPTAK